MLNLYFILFLDTEIVIIKTPNKSGLTPIRPDRSPHRRLRQKSGLNPVKPDSVKSTLKSPFFFTGSKKIGATYSFW